MKMFSMSDTFDGNAFKIKYLSSAAYFVIASLKHFLFKKLFFYINQHFKVKIQC